MRKRDELTKIPSCMTSALDDEMTFVLLARDVAAPVAIRAWADERVRIGKNVESDMQIREARECADIMDRERDAVRAQLPKPWRQSIADAVGIDVSEVRTVAEVMAERAPPVAPLDVARPTPMKVYARGLELAQRIRARLAADSATAGTRDAYGPEGAPREAFTYARGYFDALDDAMKAIVAVNSAASKPDDGST